MLFKKLILDLSQKIDSSSIYGFNLDFNLNTLYSRLLNDNIFKNNLIQEYYAKKWISTILPYCDYKIRHSEYISRIEKHKEINLDDEAFQLVINTHGIKTEILFDVEYMKSKYDLLCSNNKKCYDYINYNKFKTLPTIDIYYKNNISIKKVKDTNYDNPIIMVPFLINNKEFIVVDGNTRLTYLRNTNTDKELKIFNIISENVIKNNLFYNTHSKLMYILVNEVILLKSKARDGNYTDLDLLSCSYIENKDDYITFTKFKLNCDLKKLSLKEKIINFFKINLYIRNNKFIVT